MLKGSIHIISSLSLLIYLLLVAFASENSVLCVNSNGHIEIERTFRVLSLSAMSAKDFPDVISQFCTKTGSCTIDHCGICTDIPLSVKTPHISSASSQNAARHIIQYEFVDNPTSLLSPLETTYRRNLFSPCPAYSINSVCLRSVVLLI